jgi:hypothetical protein
LVYFSHFGCTNKNLATLLYPKDRCHVCESLEGMKKSGFFDEYQLRLPGHTKPGEEAIQVNLG